MVEPPRVSRSPDAYPASPVSVPLRSTPLCSAKALVLDGDDCQLHRVGDFVARHFEAPLRIEPGDGVALASTIVVTAGTALDQLSRAVRHHIGGAIGNEAQSAGGGE